MHDYSLISALSIRLGGGGGSNLYGFDLQVRVLPKKKFLNPRNSLPPISRGGGSNL